MLAFPEMLRSPAQDAGMKVPKDTENYNREEYPHFYIFCMLQLGRRMPYPSVHFDNAKVIAKIEEEQVKKMSFGDFCEVGFQ
jgi:hypothetical protein